MSTVGPRTEGIQAVLKTARILDLVAIGQRADPKAPLLIRGEPGVGKDVLARLIHAASERQRYSFIKVNCAVRPDRCEADLFGHMKGASPLAPIRRLIGSLEFANHGTLYLDEIENLPRTLVPRLFRVLRTGEVLSAVGGGIVRVDVRVIASTTHEAEAEDPDNLWKDLRRLNAVEVRIPPLRQRTDEIPDYASFFLEQFNQRYRRDVQLCPDVLAAFSAHLWPGNVRELEEAVRRLVVGGAIAPAH